MNRRPILHPLLFPASAILMFANVNASDVPPSHALLPLGLAVAVALILWALAAATGLGWTKGALVVSATSILFFSFGRWELLWTYDGDRLLVGSLVLAIAILLVIRARRVPGNLTRALNVASGFLVAWNLFGILHHEIADRNAAAMPQPNRTTLREPAEGAPDIFYFILDGFTREDIFAEYGCGLDDFFDGLRRLGFYVASRSDSNYMQTYPSLASSLNYEYLDELVAEVGTEYRSRRPLFPRISDNRTIRALRQLGYRYVAIESGCYPTRIPDADVHLQYGRPAHDDDIPGLVWSSTPLRMWRRVGRDWSDPYERHRQRLLFAIDTLAGWKAERQPRFVFAHLLAAHRPFVFTRGGKPIASERAYSTAEGSLEVAKMGRENYRRAYCEQSAFLGHRLLSAIASLLQHSHRAPVIILQGDHGSGLAVDFESLERTRIRERMAILNAYYVPQAVRQRLYPTISPVNSFRVLLSSLFGADLQVLPDRQFYCTSNHPYHLYDVTDKVTPPLHRTSKPATDGSRRVR